MSILDIFRKRPEMTEPAVEVVETTNKDINSDLAGIVGTQWRTLKLSKLDDPYSKHYVIWRAINLLADNISQLPLRIYKGDELMDEGFKLGSLDISAPNARMSLREIVRISNMYLNYRGEWIWYLDKLSDRNIGAITPISPKMMKINTRDEYGYPSTWKYNNKVIIPDDQLVIVKLFNPDSPDRGLGPVDVIQNELLTDDHASEYNKKFFENFGKIGGMLVDKEGKATRDDMSALASQFDARHASPENAYRILGLPAGITYQELNQTMKEMEYLEGRRDVRDRILSILGIHKAVFGVTDQVDRAVADTAMRQLWQLTLKPQAIRIEDAINRRLMKRYYPDYRVKFDFSNVEELKDDQVKKLEQAKALRDLGYTVNEINDQLGLGMEDITDSVGSMRLVPSNLIPANDYTISLEPEKTISTPREEKTQELSKYSRNFVRKHNLLQRNIEKRFTGKFRNYFSKQLGGVMAIVKSKKSAKEIDDTDIILGIKTYLNEQNVVLQDFMKPIYEDASKDAVALAQDAIGVKVSPRVSDYVVGQMINKVKGVNDYTYKLLRDQVKEASLAGETQEQLAERVKNVYKFNSSRARRIARTESANLINRSTHEEYQKNGVNKKQWVAHLDEETRPSHRENHNKGAVPFDFVYANGMRYPSDPNGSASEIISCRCALVPIVPIVEE